MSQRRRKKGPCPHLCETESLSVEQEGTQISLLEESVLLDQKLNSDVVAILREIDLSLSYLERGFLFGRISSFEFLRTLSSFRLLWSDFRSIYKEREFVGDGSTTLRALEVHLVRLGSIEVFQRKDYSDVDE